MDDLYNISILDGVETTIEQGNELVDPFNVLDVKSIKFDPDFIKIFNLIDIENLCNETLDFDEDEWNHLISQLIISEEDKSYLIRFAWWVCRELVFGPESIHSINIVDLLKNQDKNSYIRTFVYAGSNIYKIAITLPAGEQMIIKFNNNKILT